jgi:hypothetical protein
MFQENTSESCRSCYSWGSDRLGEISTIFHRSRHYSSKIDNSYFMVYFH